ncbi:MAG: hypothetical protein EBR82_39745 [Caulobacteraceae bacterium]|nr:hypothetical protein [Caulobacteraceae bacterium]
MEIGDDFLPELDFDFDEQKDDTIIDDKPINDEIPEDEKEDDNLEDDSEDESLDNVDSDENAVAAYNYYKDNNFITIDHEFDGTFNSLKEALDKQAQVSLVSAIQNFPPFLQPIIEYATLKEDVTPEEVASFLMQYQPPSFTEQDLQNDNDLAENYLTNSLKAEGLDDDEIEDRIDYLKDRNQLAKESIRQFRKDEQVRQQEMNSQLEQVRQQEELELQQQEAFIQNFGQVLNDTNWRNDHKQVIAHEFTSGNFKTRMEHIFENPKALVKLVDFLANYDGEDINLDKYKKSAFSPSVKGVKDTVEKYWSNSSLANNKSSRGGNPKVDLSELELI